MTFFLDEIQSNSVPTLNQFEHSLLKILAMPLRVCFIYIHVVIDSH